MIDLEALRSACLAGDYLESARRLLSAALAENLEISKAADAGDVSRVAAWVEQETPLLDAVRPFVTPEVLQAAPVSMAQRLIWNQPGLTAEGAVLSEMSLGATIRRGHLEAVRLLIARGADVNAPQTDGATPLARAEQHAQPEIAALLTQHGARLDTGIGPDAAREKLKETVQAAARRLSPENVNALLKAAQPSEQTLALCEAAKQGDTSHVEVLLRQTPSLVYGRGQFTNTALHHAATEGIVDRLVAGGADVNARGHMGNTPLHDAATRGQADVVRALIQHGAHARATRADGFTPLHFTSLSATAQDSAATAAVLLDSGAQIEARDSRGKTPLAEAAFRARITVVEQLLARGADCQTRDKEGNTPLHLVAGHLTPKEGAVAVADALLRAGADPNAANTAGDTPLHITAKSGKADIAQSLLDAGADLTRRNGQGDTPLHVAKDTGRREILEMLRRHQQASGAPLIPEPPSPLLVRTHSRRPEAVTLGRHATLTRWTLEGTEPRVAAHLETDHARLVDLAVSPDGLALAVLTSGSTIEIRRWDDLALLRTMPCPGDSKDRPEALAFSPNGRWLAVAAGGEEIHLLEAESGRPLAMVDGGERTGPLAFSPDGALLGAACSFQGGAHVRVDSVSEDGQLASLHELDRSDFQTAKSEFVDTLVGIAFSPDSRLLAVFETSAIYHELHPSGWRGNIALYDTETGAVRWSVSVDAAATGETRSLAEAGYGMGFRTELLFNGPSEILCGCSDGTLLACRVSDGRLSRRAKLGQTASVLSLAQGVPDSLLWVVLDSAELLTIRLDGTPTA